MTVEEDTFTGDGDYVDDGVYFYSHHLDYGYNYINTHHRQHSSRTAPSAAVKLSQVKVAVRILLHFQTHRHCLPLIAVLWPSDYHPPPHPKGPLNHPDQWMLRCHAYTCSVFVRIC